MKNLYYPEIIILLKVIFHDFFLSYNTLDSIFLSLLLILICFGSIFFVCFIKGIGFYCHSTQYYSYNRYCYSIFLNWSNGEMKISLISIKKCIHHLKRINTEHIHHNIHHFCTMDFFFLFILLDSCECAIASDVTLSNLFFFMLFSQESFNLAFFILSLFKNLMSPFR